MENKRYLEHTVAMVGFGFWEKEEENFIEVFNTIKIEGRIVKEGVTAQDCKYSSSN